MHKTTLALSERTQESAIFLPLVILAGLLPTSSSPVPVSLLNQWRFLYY